MPFLNFESCHFSEEERADIRTAIETLQTALSSKLATLTPEERQQYGTIKEQNKLVVNKVNDYKKSHPELASPEVDWEEFLKDYESRAFLETLTHAINELSRGLVNAKMLHDWDNYQAALIDYQYSTYRNDSGSTGFHTKVQEIKQFFTRTSSGKGANPPKPEEEI